MKKIVYIIFFISVFSYSQENINITFKTKGILKIKPREYQPTLKDTLLVNTLRADVKTKYGDFSLILIDINKNNNFNDFRNRGSKIGSDAIKIIDYKSTDIKIFKHQKRYLKHDYPIVFNGTTFKVKDLIKVNTTNYTATLVQEKVDLNEIIKNKNGVLIDSLPRLMINLNKTGLKYKLRDKLDTGKYFLIKFYHSDTSYSGFCLDWSKYNSLKKYKLDILYLGVKKEDKKITSYIGVNCNHSGLDFIDANNLENLVKIGYSSDFPYAILFNDKGRVVKSGLDYQQLKDFLVGEIERKIK